MSQVAAVHLVRRVIPVKQALRAIKVLMVKLEIKEQQETLVLVAYPALQVSPDRQVLMVFQGRVDHRVCRDHVEILVR